MRIFKHGSTDIKLYNVLMYLHKLFSQYGLQTGDQEECLWALSWYPSLSSVLACEGNSLNQSKKLPLEAQQQEHQDLNMTDTDSCVNTYKGQKICSSYSIPVSLTVCSLN